VTVPRTRQFCCLSCPPRSQRGPGSTGNSAVGAFEVQPDRRLCRDAWLLQCRHLGDECWALCQGREGRDRQFGGGARMWSGSVGCLIGRVSDVVIVTRWSEPLLLRRRSGHQAATAALIIESPEGVVRERRRAADEATVGAEVSSKGRGRSAHLPWTLSLSNRLRAPGVALRPAASRPEVPRGGEAVVVIGCRIQSSM
jgi:hypothetical protein